MNGSSRNSPREKRNEKLARGFVRAWIEFKWTLIIAAFSPPSFWFDIENLRLYVIVRYKIQRRENPIAEKLQMKDIKFSSLFIKYIFSLEKERGTQ